MSTDIKKQLIDLKNQYKLRIRKILIETPLEIILNDKKAIEKRGGPQTTDEKRLIAMARLAEEWHKTTDNNEREILEARILDVM